MQPRINNLSSSSAIRLALGVGVILISSLSALASNSGRVVVSREVKVVHRNKLAERLRAITGLRELTFDGKGVLALGSVSSAGSAGARELLTRSLQSGKQIVIEDATNRADIAFCRLVISPSETLRKFVVLMDFGDFDHLIGDARAQASFNVGWGLLHEVDHVISETEDAKNSLDTGECENNINKMRIELGLPIRATYRFSALPAPSDPAFITRLVRLGFVELDVVRNKTKQYWLVWDASLVGGLAVRNGHH